MNWQQMLKTGDALLAVDIQNDFCTGGSLAVPDAEEVIPQVNAALEVASAKGLPCFASRDFHPQNHCSFVEYGGIWPSHCVQNTYGAEFNSMLSFPDNVIIVNKAVKVDEEQYSALSGILQDKAGLSLLQYLKKQSIQRIWLVGLALDYCVRETALDLVQAGFNTLIALPATRAIDKSKTPRLLQEFIKHGISIIKK